MQRTIVETHGLTKRYRNGIVAASGVSMTVRRGEVYGFLGPNGAGKTTVLRMLFGLSRPTAGSAVVAGHPPGHPRGLAAIGCLVEAAAFYPFLSGRENLRLVADLAGGPHSRVDGVLEEVDLLAAAGRQFGGYSTGMKQRLGVAAAPGPRTDPGRLGLAGGRQRRDRSGRPGRRLARLPPSGAVMRR